VDSGGFAVASSAVYRTVYLSVPGAAVGSTKSPPTSETWTLLGELPASHSVLLPARSIATVVLQGRMP
jgi:hypothetical protein